MIFDLGRGIKLQLRNKTQIHITHFHLKSFSVKISEICGYTKKKAPQQFEGL